MVDLHDSLVTTYIGIYRNTPRQHTSNKAHSLMMQWCNIVHILHILYLWITATRGLSGTVPGRLPDLTGLCKEPRVKPPMAKNPRHNKRKKIVEKNNMRPVTRDSQPMQKPHGSTKIVRVTWVRGAHCPQLPPVTLTVTCIIFIKAKVRTGSWLFLLLPTSYIMAIASWLCYCPIRCHV